MVREGCTALDDITELHLEAHLPALPVSVSQAAVSPGHVLRPGAEATAAPPSECPAGTAREQRWGGLDLAGCMRSSSRRAAQPFCQAGSDCCLPTCHFKLDISIRVVLVAVMWEALLGP